MKFGSKWIQLETILLSDITQKDKYDIYPLIRGH